MTTHPDDHAKCHLQLTELEGVDELSARAFRAFLATLRLHRQHMMKAVATHGMHPGQALCLRALAAHDGIAQRDLAEALHLAPPTITKMLQALERNGAVERHTDPGDQRLTRVCLTARGRELETEMHRVAADYIGATIGTLPEDDRRDLARLLEAFAASLERVVGCAAPDDACDMAIHDEMTAGAGAAPGTEAAANGGAAPESQAAADGEAASGEGTAP